MDELRAFMQGELTVWVWQLLVLFIEGLIIGLFLGSGARRSH